MTRVIDSSARVAPQPVHPLRSLAQARRYVRERAAFACQSGVLFALRIGEAYAVFSNSRDNPIFVHLGGVWYEIDEVASEARRSRHRAAAHPLEHCTPKPRAELLGMLDAQ